MRPAGTPPVIGAASSSRILHSTVGAPRHPLTILSDRFVWHMNLHPPDVARSHSLLANVRRQTPSRSRQVALSCTMSHRERFRAR